MEEVSGNSKASNMKKLIIILILFVVLLVNTQDAFSEKEAKSSFSEAYRYKDAFAIDVENGNNRVIVRSSYKSIVEYHNGSTFTYSNLDRFHENRPGNKNFGFTFRYEQGIHSLFMCNNVGKVFRLTEGKIEKIFAIPVGILGNSDIGPFVKTKDGFAFLITCCIPNTLRLLHITRNGKVVAAHLVPVDFEDGCGGNLEYISQDDTFVVDCSSQWKLVVSIFKPNEIRKVVVSLDVKKLYSRIAYVAEGIYYLRGYLVDIRLCKIINKGTFQDIDYNFSSQYPYAHKALLYVDSKTFLSLSYGKRLQGDGSIDAMRQSMLHPKSPVTSSIYTYQNGRLVKGKTFNFIFPGHSPHLSRTVFFRDAGIVLCDGFRITMTIDIEDGKLLDSDAVMPPVAYGSGMVIVHRNKFLIFLTPWGNIYRICRVPEIPDNYTKCISFNSKLFFLSETSLSEFDCKKGKMTSHKVERKFKDICVNSAGIFLVDEDGDLFTAQDTLSPITRLEGYKHFLTSTSANVIVAANEVDDKYIFLSPSVGNIEIERTVGEILSASDKFLIMKKDMRIFVLRLPLMTVEELPPEISANFIIFSQGDVILLKMGDRLKIFDWQKRRVTGDLGVYESIKTGDYFFVGSTVAGEVLVFEYSGGKLVIRTTQGE